jgi:hypothetical protein
VCKDSELRVFILSVLRKFSCSGISPAENVQTFNPDIERLTVLRSMFLNTFIYQAAIYITCITLGTSHTEISDSDCV